jgi:lipopolysaccharide export LptBFGC system permease protein LptF
MINEYYSVNFFHSFVLITVPFIVSIATPTIVLCGTLMCL